MIPRARSFQSLMPFFTIACCIGKCPFNAQYSGDGVLNTMNATGEDTPGQELNWYLDCLIDI